MAASERKKATPEEIWEIIQRIGQSQERLGASQEETDRLIQKMAVEAEKDRKEAENGREENRQFMRKLREVQEDTWHQIKETGRQMRKTDTRFQSQWGRLMETLVDGELVRHLKQRNIQVKGTRGRFHDYWNGKEYEFDNIVVNGKEVVVVEVKTVLGPEEVKHFLNKLKDFKHVATEYKDRIVYGLVAFLQVDAKADKYAERQGLFVVRATGNSSSLLNAENFAPKQF